MFGKDFSCFSKSEVMKGVRIFLLKTEYLQQESWHVANSLNDNHEKETSQCKQIWFSEKKKKNPITILNIRSDFKCILKQIL